MKPFIVALCVSALLLAPSAAIAEQSFATAEIVSTNPESATVTTIYVPGNIQPENDEYRFEGTVLYIQSGTAVPISVAVSTNPALVAQSEFEADGVRVSEIHRSTREISSGSLTKVVYSVSGERSGTIIVTDDPLPAVAYLVIGAVTVALGWAVIEKGCDGKFETKTTYDANGRISRETVCTPA